MLAGNFSNVASHCSFLPFVRNAPYIPKPPTPNSRLNHNLGHDRLLRTSRMSATYLEVRLEVRV